MKLAKNESQQKLRGGFYTPAPITNFMLDWAINGATDYEVLEPSCGDGVFLRQMKEKNTAFQSLTAIELDEIEVEKANAIELKNTIVLNTDFHDFCNTTEQKFDLVIGNPPYIRYQFFDSIQQIAAEEIFKKADLKYSKLTNAWVSFVVGSSLLLKEKGKIAFVVPAELLQVSYAKPLRQFLAHFFNKINIVSFQKLVFPDIQQEVVLLLCERNGSTQHLIEHIEVEDASVLKEIDLTILKQPQKKIDFQSNKWTFYFLEQREIDFLERLTKEKIVPSIGDFAKVEVGITTGANNFFTVPLSTVKKYHLEDYSKPMVGRSVQVKSIRFTEDDWELNSQSLAKAHFLEFPLLKELQKNLQAMAYLEYGEKLKIHKGYKCRIREEWQIVPSVWGPDALFIRRSNRYPKLIVNEAKAYTTDTMHRVRMKEGINVEALAASFYNSLSFAFAEISGRSYGGGVLELMPSEVEQILIPYQESHKDLVIIIDEMMRLDKSIEEILAYTNEKLLKESFGFSNADIKIANSIWLKLSDRRMNRGKKSKQKHIPNSIFSVSEMNHPLSQHP
ncbi:MAG: class I SAM-dependent methyltransferase [Chitinophagales bacterium]